MRLEAAAICVQSATTRSRAASLYTMCNVFGCVQYQSDLRCACGPQDCRKLTKYIDSIAHLSLFFFAIRLRSDLRRCL